MGTVRGPLTAQRLGKKVLKMLTNRRGWKIEVWNNLGWHVALRKNGLNLYIQEDMFNRLSFSTLLSSDGSCSGETFWSPGHRSFKNPNSAIYHQLYVANRFIQRCQKTLKKVA